LILKDEETCGQRRGFLLLKKPIEEERRIWIEGKEVFEVKPQPPHYEKGIL
jgi:hypothetical protein